MRHLRLRALLAALVVSVAAAGPAIGQNDTLPGFARMGAFHVRNAVDPFDDSPQRIVANLGVGGEAENDLGLSWVCLPAGGLYVSIAHKYLAGDPRDRVQVQYRFDEEPASAAHLWRLVDGKRRTEMPIVLADSFTERARSSQRIRVRVVDPWDAEVLNGDFRLDGLAEALAVLDCPSRPEDPYAARKEPRISNPTQPERPGSVIRRGRP